LQTSLGREAIANQLNEAEAELHRLREDVQAFRDREPELEARIKELQKLLRD
jgi:cell fate (sporulation/competence/biofilm development) regulator YlbF (YheA/YmcA/DUF963 family)